MKTTAIENSYAVLLSQCLHQLIIKNNFDEALHYIADNIGNTLDINCCCFIKQNEIPTLTTVKTSWQTSDFSFSLAHLLQNFTTNNDESFRQAIITKYPVLITEATPTQEKWISFLQNTQLQNVLIIPIQSPGNTWGFMVLASLKYIQWHKNIDDLQHLATAIGSSAAAHQLHHQLYQRNEIYETTLATLNELIWEMDLRKNKIRVMGFAPRIGSFGQEEFDIDIRKQFEKTIHPDDKERVITNFENFLLKEDKATSEETYRMLSADGVNYIWVQSRRTLLCNDTGQPAIIVGTTLDINDTKQVAFELEKQQEKNELLVQMLQESNEKLNTILNSSKEIILTIDLQAGQIENVNDAIQILGYTPKEWIGEYYTNWTLEKRRKLHDLLKHASESNTDVRSQQILFSNKHNTDTIPFEFSTSLFYFKNKKYLLCVLRDIRERLAYEKSITLVTDQLTHLINNIDDVYAIYSLKENKYEFVSDNVEGFFGCSKQEFMRNGLFWKDIMHIEDEANIVKEMEEVIKNKSKGEFFYRIATPIGETKMLLEKITVGIDTQGNADKVYIVKSDYTHIENAEQSLIESERKFRFISENITDFISIIDNDGRFVYASPSAQKVIGYSPEELIGQGNIYIIHPDDVPIFIDNVLKKAVFDKMESQIRYRILSKTGDYYWVETYFKPIVNTKGETTSIICSTRDITEREQLMKDLELSLEKERELNELRSQFVSTASHQFRTPLTVIQTGVELMEIYLDGVPTAKQKPFKKQFDRIQGEVVRLQELMNDVLLLGRADAMRTPFNPERKDLIAFCKELIESKYNNRFPANRQVIISVQGNAQPILFDPKLLDHSLENILSNAYKYSTEHNIEMLLKFEYDTVCIAITDFGIGIPESDLGNLFQPFYRAGNTTEIEGTGLGLSIVKEFIDKHDGQIFVVSELNKGTTVSVILPLR